MILNLTPIIDASKQVEKVWGREIWIENGDKYCMKVLEIYPGYQCSLHAHTVKTETFVVVEGDVKLEANNFVRDMLPGHRQLILPGTYHRFSSVHGAVILEISTHHSDQDVIRKEDSRKI